MNSDIIHDPNYPHSTPQGFKNGCHGPHCPAPVACRDVHRRYVGDYAYRRQIDAGMTAAQIADAEETAVRAAEESRRARIQQAAQARHNAARNARRATVKPTGPRAPVTPLQKDVARLLKEGLTDRQVGERIGKTRNQVSATRKHLGLKCNPSRNTTAPATTGAVS